MFAKVIQHLLCNFGLHVCDIRQECHRIFVHMIVRDKAITLIKHHVSQNNMAVMSWYWVLMQGIHDVYVRDCKMPKLGGFFKINKKKTQISVFLNGKIEKTVFFLLIFDIFRFFFNFFDIVILIYVENINNYTNLPPQSTFFFNKLHSTLHTYV